MRARIVDAAAGLIYVSGVEATSLDDVMLASQASKSQLYHYFTNKDDLVRAVIGLQVRRIADLHHVYLAQVTMMSDLQAWRDAVLGLYVASGGCGGCPLGSLANELAGQSAFARADIAAGLAVWQDQIAGAIALLQANGTLTGTADPVDLATAVLLALQGGLLMSKTTRTPRPFELAFDMALAHIVRYSAADRACSSAGRLASIQPDSLTIKAEASRPIGVRE